MSEERPYPPTELKLTRLRRGGIVPISRDLTSFSIALGALLGGWLVMQSFPSSLAALVHDAVGLDPSLLLWKTLGVFLVGAASFLIPLVLLVVVVGAFQSRFLFNPGILRFDPVQTLRWRENLIGGFYRRFLTALLAGVKCLGWIWLFSVLGMGLLAAPYEPPAELSGAPVAARQVANVILAAALGYLFFFGILSRFIVVLLFRADHRMSRAELDAESRETELSPEIRKARREFQESSR